MMLEAALNNIKQQLHAHGEVFITVNAKPHKAKTCFVDVAEYEEQGRLCQLFSIAVAAAPENGKANKAICAYIGSIIEGAHAEVISGASSKRKLLKLTYHS